MNIPNPITPMTTNTTSRSIGNTLLILEGAVNGNSAPAFTSSFTNCDPKNIVPAKPIAAIAIPTIMIIQLPLRIELPLLVTSL